MLNVNTTKSIRWFLYFYHLFVNHLTFQKLNVGWTLSIPIFIRRHGSCSRSFGASKTSLWMLRTNAHIGSFKGSLDLIPSYTRTYYYLKRFASELYYSLYYLRKCRRMGARKQCLPLSQIQGFRSFVVES